LKDRKDPRVNQLTVKNVSQEKNSDITCYSCQGSGHMAKRCKKPMKRYERPGLIKDRSKDASQSGNEF
jgi:hypothetical protein